MSMDVVSTNSLILLFFLTIDYFIMYLVIYYFLNGNTHNIPRVWSYFVLLFKYFALIVFFAIYYRKYIKEKWHDFKKNFKKYFKIAFNDWIIGFVIMYLSNIIIMQIIGSSGKNEETVQKLITSIPILAFILTTILAPIIEELIFRKSLQDCFKNKKIFMIVSGLLFGFIHVMGAENYLEYLLIIPYGALGVSFAHTLNETDNIYPSMMMHAMHNGFLTLLAIMVNL